MKSWMKYMLIAAVIIAGGTLFYKKVYIVKSTFEIAQPTKGDLKVSIRGIGNVDAKNIYAITAQSGGRIEEIHFDEGMWVKKGDLLLSIDAVELPSLIGEAKATLQKSSHEAASAKENIVSLEAQKVLLEATHERYKKLLEQKFVSQAEYDKAKSDIDNIKAQVNAQKAKIASAASEEQRMQKNIEALQTKLERLKVYAPIDGYVISKEAEKASYVLPSTVIFKIVDPATLWVRANIDERVAQNVKVGQDASIKLRSKPNEKLKGTLQRVVAMSNAVTLEREVNIGFDATPETFYINEQAEVNIHIATHKDVLKVPLKLLSKYSGKKGLWVAESDRAYFKEVSVLAQNDEEAAIGSGIEIGAELLVPKINNKPLSDGMKIFR
ncbi:MAG: efflux RND transporter periplasmic adaptor subunit [Sulfurimonas sp.]|uniref:efflux RND transporter periplasmic adaptor subunit n=1 Tax=Sulfurimonas sp. TaxID=2022749 RepID=UPI00263761A5|nr:efflux RND transporter periplasmic adaptor subunit [Sulfurimonas sp.]MDD2652375.1 efflux RND transporter periplasmic adaptor subunit [Sulfurimonas sp.]MDD3451149.1 efflux RND transporter periplasmic adaptor subunit [Sulfurimonas sp.]